MIVWMMVWPAIGIVDHALASDLDALLDGGRDLFGLAVADADLALAVADGDERGEREPTTTLDDLGDAVDRDDPLVELGHLAGTLATAASSVSASVSVPIHRVSSVGSYVRVSTHSQNLSPPSRAASARALTLP